jgi:hypothetical protein
MVGISRRVGEEVAEVADVEEVDYASNARK